MGGPLAGGEAATSTVFERGSNTYGQELPAVGLDLGSVAIGMDDRCSPNSVVHPSPVRLITLGPPARGDGRLASVPLPRARSGDGKPYCLDS
jgi:hypothetical protein